MAKKNITNADEQYRMGNRYYNGDGVEQDYTQAALCYMEAAEQGYADARYALGMCYYEGKGAEQDNGQAAYWFKKAAMQSNAEAMYHLAILCEAMLIEAINYKEMLWQDTDDIPQEQKLREGLLWLILAAKLGNAEAKKQLSEMPHIDYALVNIKAEELIALAEQSEIKGLSDYGLRYLAGADAQGATRLKPQKTGKIPPYSHLKSHFNGQPYFEEGEQWPVTKDGKMLDFVFQVFNTGNIGLPGYIKLIQFYYDTHESPWSDKDGRFIKVYENINIDDAVIISPGCTKSYCYCDIEFEPISPKEKKGFHSQIGGRPQWLQGDTSPAGFQFLFQLDCETDAGLYWGDEGIVYAYYNPSTKETWFELQSC